MQYLLLGSWFTKGLKSISFLLDEMVYALSRLTFSIFCYISEATIVNDAMIEKVTRRIYVILGIAMTFIIAYYLLNYIVDPDKVNDKSSGASTLIKDIVIALVIMTMTPTLFTKLYGFQHTIITSGVISKIFLGGSSNYDASSSNPGLTAIQTGAKEMTVNVFSAFVMPKDENWSALDCANVTNEDPTDMLKYCKAYDKALEDGNISAFYDVTMDETHFRYWPLLSTVAGIGLTFFMLSFCINLAKRVGKMAILQVLAPIPALLEIVPGSKGTRKTWIDMLVKTYLEVFVFQLVVFIIIFLVTLVPDALTALFGNFDGVGVLVRVFTMVLLIFGLLQFAKEAPKMVMDLLGIKGTGTISAALKRGVNMAAVSGGLLGSTVGRFSRNAVETYNQQRNLGKGVGASLFSATRSGFGGAGSGIARTLWGARNVHSLKDAKQLRTNVNKNVVAARVRRDSYWQSHGKSFGGVMDGHIMDAVHRLDAAEARYFGAASPFIEANWGIDDNSYREKLHREEVHKKIKAKYDETIKAKYKSDAQWAEYQTMINYAKTHGGTYTDYAGNTYTISQIEANQRAREASIVSNNQAFFQDAWGSIQSIVDANQGVKGITDVHEDLSKFDMAMHERMLDQIVGKDFATGTDTGHGYTQELDNTLDKDRDFQARKQAEKRAEEARKETERAAESASNKGQGNK